MNEYEIMKRALELVSRTPNLGVRLEALRLSSCTQTLEEISHDEVEHDTQWLVRVEQLAVETIARAMHVAIAARSATWPKDRRK